MIKNPVLKGFYPDPCIICVEDTFYIANSTFEYYPPLQISKSKDLANWENLGGVLDEKHLSLVGNPASGGVWAPCLTYHKDTFYLVYSDVKSWSNAPFKDVINYITTAKSITGPWSAGIYINSSGFDPSLFHDGEKKYFINMEWDWRKQGDYQFSGLLITELDPLTFKPISEPIKVFKGTDRGLVEGPHLFKRNGWYYIVAAEGGTSYAHAVTIARSKNIYGPYEVHPNKHLASSYRVENAPIHNTGHGSLCEGPDGRWFLATLCGRPLDNSLFCPLGRESAIDEVLWKNDWPYLKNGTTVMSSSFTGYGEAQKKPNTIEYDLNSELFRNDFMSLREPCNYEIRNNELIIKGSFSPLSRHKQSFLGRRVQDFNFIFEVEQDFKPNCFQEFSGLIYRYNEDNFYFLFTSKHGDKDIVNIYSRIDGKDSFPLEKGIELENFNGKITLRLQVSKGIGTFSFKGDNQREFKQIFYNLESKNLSDEAADPMGFTGSFVGVEVVDLKYKKIKSKFSNLIYVSKDPQ